MLKSDAVDRDTVITDVLVRRNIREEMKGALTGGRLFYGILDAGDNYARSYRSDYSGSVYSSQIDWVCWDVISLMRFLYCTKNQRDLGPVRPRLLLPRPLMELAST